MGKQGASVNDAPMDETERTKVVIEGVADQDRIGPDKLGQCQTYGLQRKYRERPVLFRPDAGEAGVEIPVCCHRGKRERHPSAFRWGVRMR